MVQIGRLNAAHQHLADGCISIGIGYPTWQSQSQREKTPIPPYPAACYIKARHMPFPTSTRPSMIRAGLPALLSFTLAIGSPISLAADKPKPGMALGLESSQRPYGDPSSDANISSRRLQREIMDFSDRYVSAIWQTIDDYVASEPDPAKRVAALAWKIRFGSASMSIAASSDPRSGLLDMTTFIAVGKWSVKRHWVPDIFGERAAPLNKVYTQMDQEIWALAAEVLTPEQQKALRALIVGWEEGNPQRHEVADVRLRNLDGVQLSDFDPANSARGILASLRNLLSRVDTSLLYGERVMFYMERTPRILEQQTTLTLAQIGQSFPITTIQPDLNRLNLLVDELPIRLQAGIDHNQALIKELLPEVRSTVESGERLTKSLDATVQALRDLGDKIDPTVDYSPYLRDATSALDHLSTTVIGLNQLLEKDPATGQSKLTELTTIVDQSSNALADKVFERAIILIAIFFSGIIITLILARFLFGRRGS